MPGHNSLISFAHVPNMPNLPNRQYLLYVVHIKARLSDQEHLITLRNQVSLLRRLKLQRLFSVEHININLFSIYLQLLMAYGENTVGVNFEF